MRRFGRSGDVPCHDYICASGGRETVGDGGGESGARLRGRASVMRLRGETGGSGREGRGRKREMRAGNGRREAETGR